jgi:ABC-2 type transport system ATP-binding protein
MEFKMIEAINLTKKFDDFTALKSLNCKIPKGCIYGLVGSNGAGKSTLLRLITGIYKPEIGSVTLDGAVIYENYEVKKKMVFVPDELYFLPQASMNRMAELYSAVYENFNFERFKNLTSAFNLGPKKSVNTFSKGMKRQAAIILALSTMPEYIFFDETFDGLDPVMRNLVKKVVYSDICERNATAVLTSHSLRELEDTCDQLALLHNGGILFESDIQNLKTSLFKLQLAFDHDFGKQNFSDIEILSYTQKGSVANLIVRGEKDEITQNIRKMSPMLLDILPLSLEEVFIYEMEAVGYVAKDILM